MKRQFSSHGGRAMLGEGWSTRHSAAFLCPAHRNWHQHEEHMQPRGQKPAVRDDRTILHMSSQRIQGQSSQTLQNVAAVWPMRPTDQTGRSQLRSFPFPRLPFFAACLPCAGLACCRRFRCLWARGGQVPSCAGGAARCLRPWPTRAPTRRRSSGCERNLPGRWEIGG